MRSKVLVFFPQSKMDDFVAGRTDAFCKCEKPYVLKISSKMGKRDVYEIDKIQQDRKNRRHSCQRL